MSFVHRVDELIEEEGNALVGKAPHWERVPLKSVARVVNGFPFPSSGFNNEEEGEPVIRIRDIVAGQVGTYFKGSAEGAPRVVRGDLVIGMDGDFNSRLWPSDAALMNQRVCKIVPNESIYSKQLLSYALPGYLKLVNDHTSAVTVKHLSSRTVQEIPLPLPPRAEQDRLVSKLDELFSRIDEGERALEQLSKLVERYRQAVLKAAVTGELTRDWREARKAADEPVESGEALLSRILTARREAWEQGELAKMRAKGVTPANDRWKERYQEPALPDTANLPALPEGWCWATADALTDATRSVTYGVVKLGDPVPGGVPTLRSSNVRHLSAEVDYVKPISPSIANQYQRTFLSGGEVLVTVRGTLGGVVLAPRSWSGWNISREVALLVPVLMELSEVIAYFIGSPNLQNWLMSRTKGNTYTGINIETLKQLPIPVAPLAEIAQICSLVANALVSGEKVKVAARLEAKRAERHLRHAVLQAAFAGQIVHQDIGEEPATALLERISDNGSADNVAPKRSRRTRIAT